MTAGGVLETGSPAPPADCSLCPRLAAFRAANRCAFPEWHNAPVASFGNAAATLLIVGLAPGLKGANRTGRPFTGDHAGEILYATLRRFGFTELRPGQIVQVRWGMGYKGCMAADLRPDGPSGLPPSH